MKLILSYLRRQKWMALGAIFFLCVETFADLLQPAFMAHVVDDGVKRQDIGLILRYGAIMLGIAAAGALGAVLRNHFASHASQAVGRELRGDLYRKVQTLSFEHIDRLQPASLVTRIVSDVAQIQNFTNGILRIMTKVPILCVGAVVLIVIQTPRQTPVMAAILVVAAALIVFNMKRGYPRFGRLQQKLDKLNNVSREFLSSVRVVKAFGAEEQEEAKFSAAAADFALAGVSATRVLAVFSPLINLTVNFGIIVLLYLSRAQNAGEIGRLMASVNYMTQVLFSLGMVSAILNSAVRAAASSGRVREVLEETPAQGLPDAPEVFAVTGELVFQNVSFTYAGTSRAALEEVGFSVRPGETVGIIGPTGAGKSTLINLIPRFYDATGGQVLLDGHDVTRIDPETLRRAIAVVPQQALLFSGTVADNLRWGDQAASDEALRAAAATARADDFIQNMPDGYNTRLGQGGVNLSGGQKQRLSIARALLRNPRILILDDCTSALDATTEAAVLSGLRAEAQNRTVFLISQRVSTILRADKILCLEDGRVMGFGTHRTLLEQCAAYRAIVASQIGGERLG